MLAITTPLLILMILLSLLAIIAATLAVVPGILASAWWLSGSPHDHSKPARQHRLITSLSMLLGPLATLILGRLTIVGSVHLLLINISTLT